MKQKTSVTGDILYSFGVITDTHLNQSDTDCNSPFAVNLLANERMRYVIDDLNTRSLSHVIHLGDIVHPVPSMGELYSDSAARFHEQVAELKHPLHIIPGNHDVGDKPIKWGPAGTVRESFLDAWTTYFGAHYFANIYHDALYVGINAQLFGSGLSMEQEQTDWLHQTLQQHGDKRIFIFTHYPPFLHNEDEVEHYDNLGAVGRSKLLALIEEYQIEALFAGHVHHFWYNNYADCHCYLLPSTTFTRQDYAEMFHVGPAAEHGRNDADKLGYFIVHVYANGHTVEMVRCHGRGITTEAKGRPAPKRLQPVNPFTNKYPVMGFDLRHDWCEQVQIPATGGLDEFSRKWVRNDYGLLALWEMGAKQLRIPIADVVDLQRRHRVEELVKLGFAFTIYSFDKPEANVLALIKANSHLIAGWEIAMKPDELSMLDEELFSVCKKLNIPLYFSPLRKKSEIVSMGKQYYHVINHGYTIHDSDILPTLHALNIVSNFDGITLRCSVSDEIDAVMLWASDIQEKSGLHTSIHFRLTSDDPSAHPRDDQVICDRMAEMMWRCWSNNDEHSPHVFCDSLIDNDRGYFPRKGILDRLYNPSAGFYIVKNLHSVFNHMGRPETCHIHCDPMSQRTYEVTTGAGLITMKLCDLGSDSASTSVKQEESQLDWFHSSFDEYQTSSKHKVKWPLLKIEES